jgi:secreted protein with Ig-like and vWFA domain
LVQASAPELKAFQARATDGMQMKKLASLTMVAVTLFVMAISAALQAAGTDVSSNAAEFAIVGDSFVIMGKRSKVRAGTGEARVASNGSLSLGVNVAIGGNAQSVLSMTLGNGSHVFGDATTNAALDRQVGPYWGQCGP